VVADFDRDGNPDVLVGQCCGLAFTVVAFGKGDGTFPTSYDLAPGASSAYVAAPDVNGDKHPDIVIAAGSAIEVFLNLYGSGLPILTPTTTTLTVAPNPATVGQTVNFTATVAENPGTTTPTGTVFFLNGTTALGTSTLDGTGTATFASNTIAAGAYSVTAQYGGDASNAASNAAAVTLTIAAGTPTTTTSP
jgi:hypothetical protein